MEDFVLDLVPGPDSNLVVRPAEEPYLFTEARVSGRVDTATGAISAGRFTTPPVTFEMEALGFPVLITATFSEINPGTATGSVTSDGTLSFRTSVQVSMRIRVGAPHPFIDTNCTISPIVLSMTTTRPYDPGTQRVTVADGGFRIPAVTAHAGCSDLVIEPINEALAGFGHSMSMVLAGNLPLPPPPRDPSHAVLSIDPAGGARLRQEVTLTAKVAPGENTEATETPTGFVEFHSGPRLLGSSELDGTGSATLVTGGLSAGEHHITAVYLGSGVYASSSDSVPYRVAADPLVSWGFPDAVTIGQGPVDFDLTVTNTGLGIPIENLRMRYDLNLWIGHPLESATYLPR